MLLERFDKDRNGQLDVKEFIGFYSEAKAMYEVVLLVKSIVYVCLSGCHIHD